VVRRGSKYLNLATKPAHLFAELLDANAFQRQAVLGDTAAGKKRALQEEPAGMKRALQEEPGKLAGISGLNPGH